MISRPAPGVFAWAQAKGAGSSADVEYLKAPPVSLSRGETGNICCAGWRRLTNARMLAMYSSVPGGPTTLRSPPPRSLRWKIKEGTPCEIHRRQSSAPFEQHEWARDRCVAYARTATLEASVLVRRRCETRESLVRVSLRIRHVHSPQLIST